jgi:hypothetical protein
MQSMSCNVLFKTTYPCANADERKELTDTITSVFTLMWRFQQIYAAMSYIEQGDYIRTHLKELPNSMHDPLLAAIIKEHNKLDKRTLLWRLCSTGTLLRLELNAAMVTGADAIGYGTVRILTIADYLMKAKN